MHSYIISPTYFFPRRFQCQLNIRRNILSLMIAFAAPLVVYIEPQTEVVSYGQPAHLNCTHSTQSEDTLITWLHNGHEIITKDPSHFQVARIGRHSMLAIEKVHTAQQGMYQCMVKNNEHKQSQGTAQVLLTGKYMFFDIIYSR